MIELLDFLRQLFPYFLSTFFGEFPLWCHNEFLTFLHFWVVLILLIQLIYGLFISVKKWLISAQHSPEIQKFEIGLVLTPLSWHRSWLYVLCVAWNKLCLKVFKRKSDQDFCIWAFLSSFLPHKVKVLVIFPQNYIFKHQPNAQIIVM